MQPILLQLGPLTLYSYGVFVALAFLTGATVAYRLAKRDKLPTGNVLDYFLYAALAGLLGARLWHVLWKPSQIDSVFELFLLSGAGLSLLGGLLLAGLVLLLLLRRQRQPVGRWFDVFVISTFSGLAVGKVGSFLNGDSFGRSSDLPWAVQFGNPQAPAYIMGVAVHPLQLYAAVSYGLIALLLWRLWRRQPASGASVGAARPSAATAADARRTETAGRPALQPGAVAWLGAFLLGAASFVLEFFHAPIDSLYISSNLNVVSSSAGLLAVSAGAVLLLRYRRPLAAHLPGRR